MKKAIRYFRKTILAVFSLCLCLNPSLQAESPVDASGDATLSDPGFSAPEALPSTAVSENTEGGATNAERTPDGKYYLDFKNASLINVLNVLSNLSGINFVAGREVSDRQVNMTLDNISLEEALQALSYGCNVNYDFLPGKNIYLFRASADSPEKPPLMTRVFKLYYVKVSKLKEIETSDSSGDDSSSSSSSSGSSISGGLTTLKGPEDETADLESSAIYKAVEKILSERGKVSIDDRSNSLVVTDSEDRLKMIEVAVTQLDRPLEQVLISVLLVETFEDLDRALGIEWGNTDTGSFGVVTGGTENTSFPFFTKTGSDNDLGDWFTQLRNQFDPTANTNPGTGPNPSTATSGIRNFNNFRIEVKALETADKLKILAKPKILALDNQPALIKISTNAAIGTSTETSSAGGGAIGTSIERAEIGTILRVTPLINTGGRITLTIEPTFATVSRSTITVTGGIGAGATGDPTTRTARTTLMVNDGQTIALGGLLFSDQSKGNRKVPFFGNIPVIGKAFFTSNTKSLKDRELILFVTPTIISDPSMLGTPTLPDKRLRFEDESAPFWKVKQKEWYKEMKDGTEKSVDFDGYFNVRKNLIESTLGTLDAEKETPVPGKK